MATNKLNSLIVYFYLLIVSLDYSMVSGLKCYECGHYLPRSDGADRFVPCEHYNSSHLIDCKPKAKSCLRLSNQGLIVLQCSANCIADINHLAEREIHCCHRDGCNGSVNYKSSIWLIIGSVFLIVYNQYC